MPGPNLFPPEQVIGVFRGFQEGGLEFHADLMLPYRNEFQSLPMHGQYVLVQLETPQEAMLGRVASAVPGGTDTTLGDEASIRAIRENQPVPENVREQSLQYHVNIRVLGVIKFDADGTPAFVASHRRLPHTGSVVAWPAPELLREIARLGADGAPLGHLALGEYVYAGDNDDFQPEPWMQVMSPEVLVHFSLENLIARRSFIFARSGFGKSNLNKLLFSELYKQPPAVTKQGDRQIPVGTVIFDPDGEYFWPDDTGSPGLCDVPHLTDDLVVFTSRQAPSDYYQSFVADGIKMDIRRLNPSDVVSIALPAEQQNQEDVRMLRGLSHEQWEELVTLVDENGDATSLEEIARILQLDPEHRQSEAAAARSNITAITDMLHDGNGHLIEMLIESLSHGKLCVVDVSQLRQEHALVLSGLILQRIFNLNQQEFTGTNPQPVPTLALVEEAQTMLHEKSTAAPYISWVKEGRKYDLGIVLTTQQPGSIPSEILSQGDNWFLFHLLSTTDLMSVQQANAHFSDDLLSTLLNEPIRGHGVFWSSAAEKSYPVNMRFLPFPAMYSTKDESYEGSAIDTFATELRARYMGRT